MKKYVYNGTSYVPEIPEGELALWKAQNVLGAKNLLKYPYIESNRVRNGVTWAVNDDGCIIVNGQIASGSTYSFIDLLKDKGTFMLTEGTYLLTVASNVEHSSAHIEVRINNWDDKNYVKLAHVEVGQEGQTFIITSEMVEAIKDANSTTYLSVIAQANGLNEVFDNLMFYPMIRLASDPDNTWTPYAPSNKELYGMVRALQNGTTATTNRGGEGNSDS